MATHSSVLAWRSPGTGEAGGLLSMGSHSWTQLKQLSSSSSQMLTIRLPFVSTSVAVMFLLSIKCFSKLKFILTLQGFTSFLLDPSNLFFWKNCKPVFLSFRTACLLPCVLRLLCNGCEKNLIFTFHFTMDVLFSVVESLYCCHH